MSKKRGNFLPRLVAFREIVEGEDLELSPRFIFQREYELPDKIYFSKTEEVKCGQIVCTSIQRLLFDIKESPKAQANNENIKSFLNMRACGQNCSTCYAFLEHRAGDPPDYSDYIAVFEQVARDMIETYNEAVERAYNSGPTERIDIVFSSNPLNQIETEEELKTKPSRKLKVN